MPSETAEVLKLAPLISQQNKQTCRDNFGAFCEVVRGFDNNWHHNEWAEILQNRAYQVGDDIHYCLPGEKPVDNRWIMLLAPRNHAKSTEFTVSYPMWELGRDKNKRIVICTYSQSQSTSFLREITTEFERNEKYKEVFGSIVPTMPDKWTQHEIIVDRDRTDLKDASISATSIGGTVLSKRADIIICADILSQDNTRTSDQREKVRQWFWEVLLPVLEPGGRLIVVGTAWNADDLYHQLLGDESFQIRKRYDAIISEERQETMWPSRWSWEELMRLKKSMGSVAFAKAYRNIVLTAEDAVFKVEWLNKAKERGKNRRLIETLDYSRWDLGQLTIAAGVDLAISQKDGSDFTAMSVIGCTRDGTKIPLYAIRDKLSPAEVRQNIIDIWERFQPAVIIVENNGYQEAIRRDLADTTSLPIKAYTTGGEKFDAEIGINSMAVEFENGKWIIPYDKDSHSTMTLMDHLIEGLLRFPSGHTEDLVMATWFANNGLRDLLNSTKNATISVGKHGLW